MGFFIRPLILTTLLITTMALSACDNSTDKLNNTAPPANPEAKSGAAEAAAEVITISGARIRATAPGQKVSGAFLTLTNSSATAYVLNSVSFDAASVVEIHETSMNGKMMRMAPVGHIDIPANSSVELKPGSYHIMLMGLDKELKAGTTEPLTLTFSDNSKMIVEASVGDLSE